MSEKKPIACVSCHTAAPSLDESSTLMSRLGWRLLRVVALTGEQDIAWRCPPCWVAYKRGGGNTAT
jgi:hypothetical protein